MVQRYDLAALGTSAHPDNEGHFVKYEDYERLKQNAMDSVVQLQKRLDSLARAYAELESKVATK